MKIRNLKDSKYVGVDPKDYKFIPTGFPKLSDSINDLMSGIVTVITGRPAEGKSTFVHTILLNALDKKFNVLLVDGEHPQEILLSSLFRKVIGNEVGTYEKVKFNKNDIYKAKPHIQDMLNDWIQELHICSKYENDLSDFDKVFDLFEEYVLKHKIDFIICDNLMSLIDSTQSEMNAKQSKFMKKCSSLAKVANIPIVIVAHPNGTALKGKKIDYYQISGTSDISNLAEVVLQIIKDPTADNGEKLADGMIAILKNRYGKKNDDIMLAFDIETHSLCEVDEDTYSTIRYNWRNEGKQEEWIKVDDSAPF